MRRYVLLIIAIVFCFRPAAAQTTLSATPASIEIEHVCPHSGDESGCRQAVANVAQAHCVKHGRNAQYVRATPKERQLRGVLWWFLYNCVR